MAPVEEEVEVGWVEPLVMKETWSLAETNVKKETVDWTGSVDTGDLEILHPNLPITIHWGPSSLHASQ